MSRSSSSFTLAVFLFLAFFTIFTSAAPVRGHYGRQSEPASPAPSSSPSDSTGDNSNDNTSSGGSTSTTSGATYSGTATWFDVGLGACGKTNVNSDFIVALPTPDYDGGANCGRQIQITDSANKNTQTATVADMCPGCAEGDLDMSPALFTALDGNTADGVFQMTWQYIS